MLKCCLFFFFAVPKINPIRDLKPSDRNRENFDPLHHY